MNDWLKFEENIKDMLQIDNATTVPGSGNGKHEEDVIGFSTIVQCKYTNKKNISILAKDLDRLLNAAKLQEKLPIFANKVNKYELISILVKDGTNILPIIAIIAQLEKINNILIGCNDDTIITNITNITWPKLKRNIEKKIHILKHKIQNIDNLVIEKYNSIMSYDLFKGDI